MFNPHDSPAVKDWFQRFDAASRRLPAEERASQREEIQQHLDGLVAAKVALGQPLEAAWEAALRQFGDPAQIGRKMYQEWQQGRTGFRADMKAILFGLGLTWLLSIVFPLCAFVQLLWAHSHGASNFNGSMFDLPLIARQAAGYGGALLICTAIGRKYPSQAIRAAFYSSLLWGLIGALQLAAFGIYNKAILAQPLSAMEAHTLLWTPVWALSHSIASYLASVTRRGWYRPSLADFKLTLPRKRRQAV